MTGDRAAVMPRDIERGRQAGFKEYLLKPFDIMRVRRAVTEALAEKDPTFTGT